MLYFSLKCRIQLNNATTNSSLEIHKMQVQSNSINWDFYNRNFCICKTRNIQFSKFGSLIQSLLHIYHMYRDEENLPEEVLWLRGLDLTDRQHLGCSHIPVGLMMVNGELLLQSTSCIKNTPNWSVWRKFLRCTQSSQWVTLVEHDIGHTEIHRKCQLIAWLFETCSQGGILGQIGSCCRSEHHSQTLPR